MFLNNGKMISSSIGDFMGEFLIISSILGSISIHLDADLISKNEVGLVEDEEYNPEREL